MSFWPWNNLEPVIKNWNKLQYWLIMQNSIVLYYLPVIMQHYARRRAYVIRIIKIDENGYTNKRGYHQIWRIFNTTYSASCSIMK